MTGKNLDHPELFIALVVPAGARRVALQDALRSSLSAVGVESIPIRLSTLLERALPIPTQTSVTNEAERIGHLQALGNAFRRNLNDGAALARASMVAIREERIKASGNPDIVRGRVAYILDQLKHPSEVDLLREVYSSSFLVIAGHAPKEMRQKELAEDIARKAGEAGAGEKYRTAANDVIEADENQEGEFGQNTRDTYPKADFFVDLGLDGGERDIDRFIELLFGHPFHTPTRSEYAMYQASAASLRSSDASRQVGAAIATDNSDVVAVGANEVPFRGGGLYWSPPPSPDGRDQALERRGDDRPAGLKIRALVQLLERLADNRLLATDFTKNSIRQRIPEILDFLKGTQFMNIGEFGRTVHAEMAALIDAARRGVGVDKLTMYVTTFPCHNCAKHIIASGIKKVVYLEPYPKSRADFLHGEEMVLDPTRDNYSPLVGFIPFSGVAPRQYHQLFTMAVRGGKKGIPLKEWDSKRTTLLPRYVVRNASKSYLAAEREELDKLADSQFKWDRKTILP